MIWKFQSTLPVWGATSPPRRPVRYTPYFKPRSPAGSDPRRDAAHRITSTFQSTLPCGERRDPDGTTGRPIHISIHAPLRGATKILSLSSPSNQISIHAPLRGATSPVVDTTAAVTFQSTLPCGERPVLSRKSDIIFRISIHAPLRGATWISR